MRRRGPPAMVTLQLASVALVSALLVSSLATSAPAPASEPEQLADSVRAAVSSLAAPAPASEPEQLADAVGAARPQSAPTYNASQHPFSANLATVERPFPAHSNATGRADAAAVDGTDGLPTEPTKRASSPVRSPAGYVRGRDGRRVAAVSRQDLLHFRRLVQPQRRFRIQPVTDGRFVIAYTSALAGPPVPVSTLRLPPGAPAGITLPPLSVHTIARPVDVPPGAVFAAPLGAPTPQPHERPPDRVFVIDKSPAAGSDEHMGALMRAAQRVEPFAGGEESVEQAIARIRLASDTAEDADEQELEGSGDLPTTPAATQSEETSTTVTVEPLDDERDLEAEDVTEEDSVLPSEEASTEDYITTTAIPTTPPQSGVIFVTGPTTEVRTDSHVTTTISDKDSDILLAIANDDGGRGTSVDEVGISGPRPPDHNIPATRDVRPRVHGPNVFSGLSGVRSPPAGAIPKADDRADSSGPSLVDAVDKNVQPERTERRKESGATPALTDKDSKNASLAAPVLAGGGQREASQRQPNASGAGTSEPIRRQARGSFQTAAPTPAMSTAAISAVSVGGVLVVTVIVVVAGVVMVRRSGVLKRRSILSDPPLDDTRLSYINASTEFSSSDLGDEMTNLENLDNDSFLNSLESMNDSAATQSCWSRDIRHSKL